VVRLTDEAKVTRDEFIQGMFDRGIGCSVHYIPLHLHPYWRDTYHLSQQDFPNSQRVYEHAVTLPLYTKMTDDDQTRVIAAAKAILK
jgi:dTDP-4-amino-4,6-dideoxygalactose transaminase